MNIIIPLVMILIGGFLLGLILGIRIGLKRVIQHQKVSQTRR
jgi:uncharacterized integral membrane protein